MYEVICEDGVHVRMTLDPHSEWAANLPVNTQIYIQGGYFMIANIKYFRYCFENLFGMNCKQIHTLNV